MEAPPPMHRLPDELLLRIFSLLSMRDLYESATRSCDRWYHLLSSVCPLETLHFGPPQGHTAKIRAVLRVSRDLRQLLLADRCDAHLLLAELAGHCPKLKVLDVRRCSLPEPETRHTLRLVVRACPHIRRLTVKGCMGNERFYQFIQEELVNVRALNFSHGVFGDRSLRNISSACTHLTELRASRRYEFTDGEVLDKGIRFLCNRLGRRLTVLKLSGRELTDSGVEALAQGCRLLTVLHLNGVHRITGAALSSVSTLPALTSLELSEATSVPCQAWLRFLAEPVAGRLQTLRIPECSSADEAVALELGPACPQLTKLDLCKTAVGPFGVECVLRHCPRLSVLKVREIRGLELMFRIIWRYAPQLKVLHCLPPPTPYAAQQLGRLRWKMPHLEVL